MTSPFAPYANAVLEFRVPDGSHYVNDDGNYVQNFKTIEVVALLKLRSNSRNTTLTYATEIERLMGLDSTALLLDGYLVDPQVWPSEIDGIAECNATIRTSLSQSAMTIPGDRDLYGRFKLLPPFQTPYVSALKIDLITPIIGVFSTKGFVNG